MSTSIHTLRLLRIQAGFATQEALASYLCITRRTVSRWETRRCQPRAGLYQQLRDIIAKNEASRETQGAPTP